MENQSYLTEAAFAKAARFIHKMNKGQRYKKNGAPVKPLTIEDRMAMAGTKLGRKTRQTIDNVKQKTRETFVEKPKEKINNMKKDYRNYILADARADRYKQRAKKIKDNEVKQELNKRAKLAKMHQKAISRKYTQPIVNTAGSILKPNMLRMGAILGGGAYFGNKYFGGEDEVPDAQSGIYDNNVSYD